MAPQYTPTRIGYCAIVICLLSVVSLFVSGCATMARGGGEHLDIQSYPSGAEVRLSTGQSGITPFIAEIRRKDGTIFVTCTKPGYKQLDTAVIPGIDGVSLGLGTAVNFLFLPIVNDIVDYSTRANYSHKPNPLVMTLIPADSTEVYHLVAPPGVPPAPPAGAPTVVVVHATFKNRLGLEVTVESDRIVVTHVMAESAANSAGINQGDQIVKYNGEPSGTRTPGDLRVLASAINSPLLTTCQLTWLGTDGVAQTATLEW